MEFDLGCFEHGNLGAIKLGHILCQLITTTQKTLRVDSPKNDLTPRVPLAMDIIMAAMDTLPVAKT